MQSKTNFLDIFDFFIFFLGNHIIKLVINVQGRPHIWGHGEMSSPCFRPFSTENLMVGTKPFTVINLYSICVLPMF